MGTLSRIALASSIFFLACGASTPRVADAPAAPGGPGPVEAPALPAEIFPAPLRLPDDVIPRAYDLTLRIDPAAPTFSGEVTIDVDVARPTRLVRLHADGLTITRALAHFGGATLALDPRSDGSDLALVALVPLPVGRTRLELAWQGPLPETPVGIYRVEDQGHPYVYTQFEPLEARRAFPSFDEPRFKTPYTTAIETPSAHLAVTNNPERARGPGRDPGWTRHAFETTPPLPTYLVALAVGDFDVVDGGLVSTRRIPFRIIAPKGKGHLAAFALERTPRYLEVLERWFGSPYPYAKLDFVAVPSFSSSGMENVGLVTYREALLLMDGERAPLEDRVWAEAVMAHELAHMWFGDLVTMTWWDDIWLNEAFATWMARKVVDEVSPELDMMEQAIRSTHNVMSADVRQNARAVRQPIASDGDIYNAFDGITYSKGAAILEMVERWIGPDRFRAGVRAYLEAFAHGNATTADLLAHLERAAGGAPVEDVVASFVDQPGVPLVELSWRCETAGEVVLEITQTRSQTLGDARPTTPGAWRIPVCARLSDGRQSLEHCGLLDAARASWPVKAGFCPTFAHPNIDEAGYYRWETTHGPVSIARGDKAAFAGYVASLRGAIDAGRRPLAELLDGIEPLFEASVTPMQLVDLVTALGYVARYQPEAPDDARYRKKARALLSRIPLDPSLGHSPRERRRMATLVRALAGHTHDERVRAHAAKVAEAFLSELEGRAQTTTPIEDVSLYLPLHVRALGHDEAPRQVKAREALWTRLRAAFDKVRNPSEREVVIDALASFDDPAQVLKTYELLLDGTLRAQDMRTVRGQTSGRKAVSDAVWRWLTERFDAVVERLGAKAAPSLPGLAFGFCSEEEATRVESFFAARRASLPSGLDRPLAQTLEAIRACAVARARYGDEARAWYTD